VSAPTPWKAHPIEHGIQPPLRCAVTVTTDDRDVVVYVAQLVFGGQGGAEKLEKYGALIAAVPDLLASLRKMLAAAGELHYLGFGCPECLDDHEDTGEDCPMLKAGGAAIAKAEGRS
jgi:hypothetical protein